MKLEIGKKYKWKHDNIVFVFACKNGAWNQFVLDGGVGVYCEALDSDLHLMEAVE